MEEESDNLQYELKTPNQKTLQAIEELESGKGISFNTVDELFYDLKN